MMRWLVLAVVLVTSAVAHAQVTAATRELMRNLASGKVTPTTVIDPARGIVEVSYTSSEGEEIRTSRRLCGADAVEHIEELRVAIETAADLGGVFTCRNKPGPPTCTVGIAGEFAVTRDFVFRRTPKGHLVLDTIVTMSSAYRPTDTAKVVAKLRAKHAKTRCR